MKSKSAKYLFACCALALASLIAPAPNAFASVITYADQAAFNAATTGVTSIGFEGIAPTDDFTAYGPGGSLTLSGTTFTAAGPADLFVNSSTYYFATFGVGYNLGSGDYLLVGNNSPATLEVQLPGGFTAIAFDIGTFDDPTSQITITLSSGDVLTTSAPIPSVSFVGFTSTTPITSLEIAISGGDRQDTLSIDNFQFGTAVPEPSTLALAGLGGFGLLISARRRRQAA